MDPEEKALTEDVANDRRATPKRIYADWLEDHTDSQSKEIAAVMRRRAHAYRWAASRELHPHVTQVRGNASWRKGSAKRPTRFDPAGLHPALFEMLPRGKQRRDSAITYVNVDAAFEALAVALQQIKALYEVKP